MYIDMGEKNNHKKIRTFDMIMSVIVTGCGAVFFLLVMRSITGIAHSTWIAPMIAASVFIAFFIVFSVTVGIKKLIAPIVLISFLPSIIFMPVLQHIIVVVIMMGIALYGFHMMRHTLFNLIKIDMPTIIRSGIIPVSLSLVIVISSQYYFYIKNNENFIFDISNQVNISNKAAEYLLQKSMVGDMSVRTMTVDEFLHFVINTSQNNSSADSQRVEGDDGMLVRWAGQITGATLEQIKKSAEDQAIIQMRSNMSEILGSTLQGNELISQVVSDLIDIQVNRIITGNTMLRDYQIEIFGSTFFIVLLSIAPIVRISSGFFARILFMFLREFKIIRITKMQSESEVISV